MSGVQTSLTLTDRLTGPLTKMMRAMDRTISIMERMDRTANNVDTRGLQRARRDIQNATADLERLRSSTNSLGGSNGLNQLQNQFLNLPGPIGGAAGAVRNFFAGFVGAAAAVLSIQALANGFKSFVYSSDNYTSTSARLANINDGLQTQVELQKKVYQAAQRSLMPVNDMASNVAKLNLLAPDAFSGNNEAIKFSELMSKSFAVSGASTQEKQAGMYQLTQAMAAGRLQGDEFRSIMENAPLLAQAIADSVGVSMGELREMSREGTITADVIKNALFGAAGDIEDKFSKMPLTFADAMTVFRNWAGRAFEPMFIRFNQFVNSDAFGTLAGHAMWFVNMFTTGMGLVFDTLEWFYNTVSAIGQFFANNWSVIGPILTVIGVVLGSITAILLTKYTILGLIRMATLAWAAAQWVVNSAYLANPITWVLIGIVAVIALIIYALINWADQTAAVIGFISGLFAALGTFIWNQFMHIWNMIATVAEFLINIFIDPTYAVKKLFYDMVQSSIGLMASLAGSFDNAANILGKVFVSGANIAIGAINGLISALNMIPGVDIGKIDKLSAGSASSRISDSLKNFANNLEAPTSSKSVVSIPRMELKSIPGAFNAGNEFGQKMSNKMSNGLTNIADKISDVIKGPKGMDDNPFVSTPGGQVASSPGAKKDAANPTGGKLDKVGKIEDEISISDEDLKMLRELADIRSIQNYVTLTPKVSFGDVSVRDETDIDAIVEKAISAIDKNFEDEMNRSVKGAYK